MGMARQGVTFEDKLGTLSIIDALRVNDQRVQDVLNLGETRKKVEDKVREHYESQGVEVSDDLVRQGVDLYFSRRYRIDPGPTAPALLRWLVRMYIGRAATWRKYKWSVILAVLFGTVGGVGAWQYQSYVYSQSKAQAESLTLRGKDYLRTWEKELKEFSPATHYASASLPKAVERAQESLLRIPEKLSRVSADASNFESRVDDLQQSLQRAANLVHVARTIASVDHGLSEWLSTTPASVQEAIFVRQIFAPLVESIEQGKASDASKMLASLQTISQKLGGMSSELAQLKHMASSEDAAPDAKRALESIYAQAEEALKAADMEAFGARAAEFRALHQLVFTPIDMKLTLRRNTPTGVERTYDRTGGKSWYLVVETTDPAGKRIAVPLESAETGEQRSASLFAVRVPQQVYETVRKDKSDGVLDERDIAHKRAGSLNFDYSREVMPGVIFKW